MTTGTSTEASTHPSTQLSQATDALQKEIARVVRQREWWFTSYSRMAAYEDGRTLLLEMLWNGPRCMRRTRPARNCFVKLWTCLSRPNDTHRLVTCSPEPVPVDTLGLDMTGAPRIDDPDMPIAEDRRPSRRRSSAFWVAC